MDLEHDAQELEDSERLRRTKDERMRDVLITEQVGRIRLRISELHVVRAGVRKTLLLPEQVTRG